MKKTVPLLLTSMLFATVVSAQIKKGSVLLGGSLGSSHYQYENSNNTEGENKGLSLYPSIGMFVKDHLALGVNTGFGRAVSKDNNNDQKSTSYSLGVYTRRYLTLGKGFYLFGEANAGYYRSTQKRTTPQTPYAVSEQHSYTGIGFYPGVVYAVNRFFQLEASLNGLAGLDYSTSKVTTTSNGVNSYSKNSGVSFNTNASNSNPLSVGFRFVFGK